MIEFGKDKIAIFLVCTSVLGGETQAYEHMQAQSPANRCGSKGSSFYCPKKIF